MYLKLAPDPCHPPLQLVDYSYNTRGWLTNINDVGNLGNDLFSFRLGYNEGSNPLYNGNIAKSEWKTANVDQSLKSYTYTYDALNRIKKAVDNTGNYNLHNVVYDKNGNITALDRKGQADLNATIFGFMDVLAYTYDAGNKLLKVSDNGPVYGFKDGTNSGNDYTYDTNGNMITDANKGITSITYNHLNLPTQVTLGSGNIQYIYDATGVKQKKVVNETGLSSVTTEYAGNYIYEGSSLQFFNHAEGYIEPDGSGGYDYIYQYKDHLGNIRLAYHNSGTAASPTLQIREENNYYPFGLKHKGYNGGQVGRNHKYGFQEQERQEELGLNWISYKFRNHDPAIGRFFNVDPLTEKYSDWGPYVFSGNRLIDARELEGLEPHIINQSIQDARTQLKKDGATASELAEFDEGAARGGQLGIAFATLFIPGPEDVVFAGAALKALAKYADEAGSLIKGFFKGSNRAVQSFDDLPDVGKIDPSKIKFSQNSISAEFKDGGKVKDLTKGLEDGSINADDIPSIRITEKDGKIFTLDNRRLKAFQDAKVDINFKKVDFKDLSKNDLKKFTTKNGGESIKIRGD
ncbi:RHS repeat-associated core domain-containing protein [Flavobacteriaceae bacterium 3-367]